MGDRDEISNCIGVLAVHIDARRWDEVLDLFAPEVEIDYTSLFGGESQSLGREQLIANWRQLVPGFTRTTHVIGSPSIAISGQIAQACASVMAWHVIDDPDLKGDDQWRVGGCYEFTFIKAADGRWRISALTLARAWSDGNQDLPRLAGEHAARTGA